MSHWESCGKSDEWYTPKYIFEALGCRFDCDVANKLGSRSNVPADAFILCNSLHEDWGKYDFIWMNPPFGGRNGIVPWMDKFFSHTMHGGNGIALTPDRTSTHWWNVSAHLADAVLFIEGKVKFERSDGSIGKQPSNGTTLFAVGSKGVEALKRARKLGVLLS